jgi:iron complex transport system permease protein
VYAPNVNRSATILLVFGFGLAAACLLRLTVGGDSLALPDSPAVWALRGHRVLAALSVGGLLACAGVFLQTMLRNPLASPDVIGVSSGASLAVMISVYLGSRGVISSDLGSAAWQTIPAAVGALAVLGVLIGLAGRGGRNRGADPLTLLLTGVVISVLCGAGVMFLQYLMPDVGFSAARLLMGTISDDNGTGQLTASLLAAAALVFIGVLLGRGLDAMALSDDEAASVGVNLRAMRLIVLVLAGVACAIAVSLAGPIGFVGLIAPHVARLALGVKGGASHRVLIPAAALCGATVVVLADAAVKAVNLGAGRMPIGVITAIIGGPLLIFLLRRYAWLGLS